MNSQERERINQELTEAGYERIATELGLRGRRQGSGYQSRCPHPEHEDRNPSFWLYIKDGVMRGHCHSRTCYSNLTVFNLFVEIWGCGFKETLQRLRTSGLISFLPSNLSKTNRNTPTRQKRLQAIPKPQKVEKVQHRASSKPCPLTNEQMLSVWKICKRFQAQYNKRDFFPARRYLESRGIWNAANDAGLTVWSGKLPKALQPLFKSHIYVWKDKPGILIPVRQNTSIAALQVRLFEPYKGVKYYLPKGTPASKIVWNSDALQSMKPGSTVFICECIIDALSAKTLWTDCVPLAVFSATFSKALEQVIPLLRQAKPARVVIAGDSDTAGQKFKDKVKDMLLNSGFGYDNLKAYDLREFGVKDMNELLVKHLKEKRT